MHVNWFFILFTIFPAFLALYDRVDETAGYLIVDIVEFPNEAWGNDIGVDTVKDWIDGMFHGRLKPIQPTRA